MALNEPTIAQTVLFSDLADRPLVAIFDQSHASSDGCAAIAPDFGTRIRVIATRDTGRLLKKLAT